MALTIEPVGPPPQRSGRLRVRAWRIAGLTLYLIAALASLPAVWFGFGSFVKLLYVVFDGETSPEDDPYSGDPLPVVPDDALPLLVLAWLVSVAIFFGAWRGARRLLRVGRNQVLFLRRFQHSPATRAVSTAIEWLGGDWRCVTLDDTRTEAMGSPPMVGFAAEFWQRISRLFDLPTWWLWAPLAGSVVATGIVLAMPGGVFGAVARAFAQLVSPFGLVITGLAMSPVLFFISRTMKEIRHTGSARTLTVREITGISEVRTIVRDAVRTAAGPRLIVVDVIDGSIWKHVVEGFATDSVVGLIDVSEPTCQILWEIKLLSTRLPRPCVFVAEQSRAKVLAEHPLEPELDALLAGRPILTYDPSLGTETFVPALRSALEHAIRAAPAPVGSDGPSEDELDAEPAALPEPQAEKALRARMTSLVEDVMTHYAAQRPRRTPTAEPRLRGEVYRDRAGRVTIIDVDGSVETALHLPATILDRYGRRVVTVVIRDPIGRIGYHLRFPPGAVGTDGGRPMGYAWSPDRPVHEENHAVPTGCPINADPVRFQHAERLVADVAAGWNAQRQRRR